jgi:cytochrome c oxidase subunit 4
MNSIIVPKKVFVRIWLALLVLLVATWGLAQCDLHHFNVAVALTIALVKMVLVILYFMHVRYKPPLTWIFVAAGFILLMIMINLTLGDYLTRGAVRNVPDKSWEHGAWPATQR